MFDQLYPEAEAPARPSAVAVAAPTVAVTSIKGAVMAQFKATEPVLQTLVARYADVAIDCSTPKGLAAAKEARHDMRENGRFVVQRAEKAIKDEVNGLKTVIASEAERLIAIVQPTETVYDEAIKAREAELTAEKAERERKEAERVAAHRANLAKIAGYPAQLQGKTSEQIYSAIATIEALEFDPAAWEEFTAAAVKEQSQVIWQLHALAYVTKGAEDDTARREAQRIENERRAAELAAREAEMAAKQAELDRQLAEIAAAKKAEADRIAAEAKAKEDAERAEAEARARQAAEDEANAKAQEAAAAAIAAKDAEDAAPEEVSDDALAARPEIADTIPAVEAPAAAEEPMHIRMAVSTGVLHPAPEAPDMDVVAAAPWSMPVQFAERPAADPNEPATLKLGTICDRLGFTVTAKFVTETLGITPAGTAKAAVLFTESQFITLCDRLVEHLGEIVAAIAG